MGWTKAQAASKSAVLNAWLGPMFKELKKNYCEMFKDEVRIDGKINLRHIFDGDFKNLRKYIKNLKRNPKYPKSFE